MQRVAQDWLVLSLPWHRRHRARHHHRAAVPARSSLLSPYAGVIADRFPKRVMLQLTQLDMAVSSLVLGVIAVSGHAQVWQVYLLAFVFGIGSAFDVPARQSFVSEMVGPDDLTNAVGPQLGGVQHRPLIGPGSRRSADRAARRRCQRHRLGDPGQRGCRTSR